ncbi:hypothetical protein D9613_003453 [Agrocybe pediades]|uniref:Uncharacterized protein n=1 Tax=Agrocybe pediades TaxID=84607 RepID=A0A8H4QPQ7_9AGAR|nr:hypothetical protein D9613_003453 [Agrocybe pediades]
MAEKPTAPDPKYWSKGTVNGRVLYSCRVCNDGRAHEPRKCRGHESTQTHRSNLLAFERNSTPPISDEVLVEDGVRHLIDSFIRDPEEHPYPLEHPSLPPGVDLGSHPRTTSAVTGIDYHLWSISEDTTAERSYEDRLKEDVGRALRHYIDDGLIEDDDNPFGSDLPEGDESTADPLPEDLDDSLPRKRARGNATDPQTARNWYPWPDRITCTLDILMHLPRSVFSRKQLDLFLWLLRVNKVDDVPSIRRMTTLHKALQNMCGIQTKERIGRLGHRYHINDLHQMLAQEMCNPKVRSVLHFYPEDAGERLAEARQGSRWLHDLPLDEATPMIRLHDDFYIFEPTMLRDGSVCVPIRWFTRQDPTSGKDIFYCRAWMLEPRFANFPDAQSGWVVRQDRVVEVSQSNLLKSFPALVRDFSRFQIPDPRSILGVSRSDENRTNGESLEPWSLTDPVVGNRWRSLSKGHRTLALPLWVYCDDTSGNTSKKWNEHNSFLFSLSGLPREDAAKEYNVHFLCTSNLAPPLEMMEGVVDQIEDGQKKGIWAWDCINKEPVLVFPSVLALLGDNPMHSEFACHIGLTGKYFCRTCWVKGTDAQDAANVVPAGTDAPESLPPNPPPSISSSVPEFENSGANAHGVGLDNPLDHAAGAHVSRTHAPPPSVTSSVGDIGSEVDFDGTPVPHIAKLNALKPRGWFKESMQAMVTRIKTFLKPAKLRTRSETMKILDSYFEKAQHTHTKTRLRDARRDTGIKDTVQEYFIEKLQAAYEGKSNKEAALAAAVSALPSDITSPVWRLSGLDPHQDTPVEILHVVLLGFVKYFWRDLVKNRLSTDEERSILITRLNDLDVSGLEIPKLAGKTLVKYAGSLTGRDFRAIAQVAPFVIYGLVSEDIYEAWVSLSALVPLIWQPVILNATSYLTTLEAEIHNFLLKTARWSTSWFNKAKFHIVTHLPEHVRRFGPAILFATEAFESFNAVIRAKSVHSNRLAPSRDIALAFGQGNRVRHLFSGGYFVPRPETPKDGESDPVHGDPTPELLAQADWQRIGPAASVMIGNDRIPQGYLGLAVNSHTHPGQCENDSAPARPFNATLTWQKFPNILTPARGSATNANDVPELFITSSKMRLLNGDTCPIGQYVILQQRSGADSAGSTNISPIMYLGCVREILQQKDGDNRKLGLPDGILIQTASQIAAPESGPGAALRMPRLVLTDQWSFVHLSDILCTVNTQHNCLQYDCRPTGFRHVYQERVQTGTRVSIQHSGNLGDKILNTAQMRDAIYVQQFRIPSTPLDEDTIVVESVARTIDQRRAADLKGNTTSTRLRGQAQLGGQGAAARGGAPISRGRGYQRQSGTQRLSPSGRQAPGAREGQRREFNHRNTLLLPGESVIDFTNT